MAAFAAGEDPGPDAILTSLSKADQQAVKDFADHARAGKEDFKATLNSLAKAGGLTPVIGPDKTLGRIAEKAVMEYGGDLGQIRDAVRGEILVSSHAEADKVLGAMRTDPAVMRIKDTISTPSVLGWRDAKGIVKTGNGALGEVQVVFKPLEQARVSSGTAIYKKMRTAAVGSAPYLAAMAASLALYNQAYANVPKGGG